MRPGGRASPRPAAALGRSCSQTPASGLPAATVVDEASPARLDETLAGTPVGGVRSVRPARGRGRRADPGDEVTFLPGESTVSTPSDGQAPTSYEIYHDRLAAGILDWRRRFVRRLRLRRLFALVIVPALLLAAFGTVAAISERRSAAAAEAQLKITEAELFKERQLVAIAEVRNSP
jgi:hypothetical protein